MGAETPIWTMQIPLCILFVDVISVSFTIKVHCATCVHHSPLHLCWRNHSPLTPMVRNEWGLWGVECTWWITTPHLSGLVHPFPASKSLVMEGQMILWWKRCCSVLAYQTWLWVEGGKKRNLHWWTQTGRCHCLLKQVFEGVSWEWEVPDNSICDSQLMGYRLWWTYCDKDLEPIKPNFGPGEGLHVPIFHDESIFRANDLSQQVWVHDRRMPLWKKGQGCAIHVSDFIVKQSRRLTLSPVQIEQNSQFPVDEQLQKTDVHEIIYLGKNHDGFWTNEKLVEQVSHFAHCYVKRCDLWWFLMNRWSGQSMLS